MLQVSQIENPICSATIDQIRLRRAMDLPVDSQNFGSSGFHCEIQVVFRWLIRASFVLTDKQTKQKCRPGRSGWRFPTDSGVAVGPSLDLFGGALGAVTLCLVIQASCQCWSGKKVQETNMLAAARLWRKNRQCPPAPHDAKILCIAVVKRSTAKPCPYWRNGK